MTTDSESIKPFNTAVVEDPEILHAQLREKCPVAMRKSDLGPLRSGWLVTRYEDIVAVTRDTEPFAHPVRWPGRRRPPLESNPPEHRQFRALLQPFFMPKALALFEAVSRRIAASMVSALIDTHGGDFARGLNRHRYRLGAGGLAHRCPSPTISPTHGERLGMEAIIRVGPRWLNG